MERMGWRLILCAGAALFAFAAQAQVGAPLPADAEQTAPAPAVLPGLIADWTFQPPRALPAPHDAVAHPPVAPPAPRPFLAPVVNPPRLWFGAAPTDRRSDLLDPSAQPRGPFTLWHNGEKIAEAPAGRLAAPTPNSQVEVAGYLAREPHMALGDLVRRVGIYGRALTPAEIAADFASRRTALERGVPTPGRLHFTSGGPLLQATNGPARLLWETDRPTSAVIEWGAGEAPDQRAELPANASRVRAIDPPGLKPDTVYRYRVTVTDGKETLASPLFTFRTAPPPGAPVVFADTSDTVTHRGGVVGLRGGGDPVRGGRGALGRGACSGEAARWTGWGGPSAGAWLWCSPSIPIWWCATGPTPASGPGRPPGSAARWRPPRRAGRWRPSIIRRYRSNTPR